GHPLAPWAALRAAELLLVKEPATALALVAPLDGPWPAQDDATVLRAKALLASTNEGERRLGVASLRDLAAAARDDSAAVAVTLPLAGALSRSKDVKEREEAVQLYWRIASRLPGTTV